MTACKGFSKGRIQFIPNNQQQDKRNYSDRTVIELREDDLGNITLRALDIEKNNQKIFDIRLKKEDQYKYGRSDDSPDEIRSKDGTYRLWLNKALRDGFYEELRKCFELLSIMPPPDSDSDEYDQDDDLSQNNRNSSAISRNVYDTPIQSNPSVVSPKDLLLAVHDLGKYIEEGDARSAARIASELASKGVRLQAKSSRNSGNEKEFTIQVQLDGNEYNVDQHGATIPVDVFQSTTVRELRAIFELVYHHPPTNQYFFVNGRLAHDNSTMKELNVGPNSLFVLFLLTHPRAFRKNGPWQCSTCRTNNQQDNLRCRACSAARRD